MRQSPVRATCCQGSSLFLRTDLCNITVGSHAAPVRQLPGLLTRADLPAYFSSCQMAAPRVSISPRCKGSACLPYSFRVAAKAAEPSPRLSLHVSYISFFSFRQALLPGFSFSLFPPRGLCTFLSSFPSVLTNPIPFQQPIININIYILYIYIFIYISIYYICIYIIYIYIYILCSPLFF